VLDKAVRTLSRRRPERRRSFPRAPRIPTMRILDLINELSVNIPPEDQARGHWQGGCNQPISLPKTETLPRDFTHPTNSDGFSALAV